jgi:hypothetical protein
MPSCINHIGLIAACDDAGLNQTSCQQTFAAGRCYQLNWWSGLTWFAARADCISHGGDLLRLDTAELVSALTSNTNYMSSTRWWIDGVNELWTWTNGMICFLIIFLYIMFALFRN